MIIIISGTSSSGKSTVSQALQHKLGDTWLLFSTDGYLSMLGEKFLDLHPDNKEVLIPNDICYAKKHADATYEIIPGKLCGELYSTIPDVITLLANKGFNIIVDSFITVKDDFNNYKSAFQNFSPLFIYLYASEKIISEREDARGDRLKGSAIHWLKKFDFQTECDLAINTDDVSTATVCEMILNQMTMM